MARAHTHTAATDDYQQLIKQRLSGQPVAYLVGTRDFWLLELNVCADVLIPRPDY